MGNVTIKWNPGWEKAIEEQIRKSPLQKQLNERAQSLVKQVDNEMKGGDPAAIHAELVKRVAADGFEPNVENLREFAQAIADGKLKH